MSRTGLEPIGAPLTSWLSASEQERNLSHAQKLDQALAEKLAVIGLDEAESPRRNGALRLLRGRHDLLPIPVRARIALRDADDCVALDKAVSSLRGAGSEAESDETRYRAGECKKLLRRPELCGCPPKGSGKIRGPKGRGL